MERHPLIGKVHVCPRASQTVRRCTGDTITTVSLGTFIWELIHSLVSYRLLCGTVAHAVANAECWVIAPAGVRKFARGARLPVPGDAHYEHLFRCCAPLVLVCPRTALRSKDFEGLQTDVC